MRHATLMLSAMTIILFSQQSFADVNCRDALVVDTYKSKSQSWLNWQMAKVVTKEQWIKIKQSGGAGVEIYGVPVGASYEEFQNNILKESNNESASLNQVQFDNIAWTFLDPSGAKAYQDCVDSVLNQDGIHVAVIRASSSEVALRVSYRPRGREPNRIQPSWEWSGQTNKPFPRQIYAGTTPIIVKRPSNEIMFSVGFEGLSDSISITPLNDKAPPPTIVVSSEIKSSGPLPSGACRGWSNIYRVCTDPKPGDWKLVSENFQLSGDRSCTTGYARCNRTELDDKHVCYEFQMQGHDEECSWRSNNTGIHDSVGNLQTTWTHNKASRPNFLSVDLEGRGLTERVFSTDD